MQPIGKKIKRVFIDEFHDMIRCHPDRKPRWQALAKKCSQLSVQIILLSATCPPSMTDQLLKPFTLQQQTVAFIRGPTDREEIGLHYVRALSTADDLPLHRIVACLHAMLEPEERILVFFNGKIELSKFASKSGCAAYHSDLCEPGDTMEENILRWDAGETKVMACTTGFAQGVDRPNVRFVVMKNPEYGLLVTVQMVGRAGRDGKRSHAIVVDTEPERFLQGDLASSNAVRAVLGNDEVCRVFSTSMAFDGAAHAYKCAERPRRVACDVCNPSDPVHRAVVAASKGVAGSVESLAPPAWPMKTDASLRQVGVVQTPKTKVRSTSSRCSITDGRRAAAASSLWGEVARSVTHRRTTAYGSVQGALHSLLGGCCHSGPQS